MALQALQFFTLFALIGQSTFGAILDDSRDEEHPQGLADSVKDGWKLGIYPQTQPHINVLLKRVDDTLNLTCKIEASGIDNDKDINGSVVEGIEWEQPHDQIFRLSWYLPFGLENSKNRVYNFESHNSLQLVVDKLREADSGEYKCKTESLSEVYTPNRYIHASSVILRVLPKKGTCSDALFSCGSGECIAKRYLCDGKRDCISNDDESQHQCGAGNVCEGKIQCSDGRCLPSDWCCDRSVDRNCSVRTIPKCCFQRQSSIQVNLDVSQYAPQPHHYNDMGFLQTTIYTVIGCAMAFMFIITIMVIAICRVHLKRAALSRYSHQLAQPGSNQRQDSWSNIFPHPPGLPYASPASGILVTYNINNGVQFMGNRPLHPPPYSEIVGIPPREGPPPPYDSRENVSTSTSTEAPPSSSSSRPPVSVSNFFRPALERSVANLRRTRTEQSGQRQADTRTLEPLLNNDNNNGDINGNNTDDVDVEPNRNRNQDQPS